MLPLVITAILADEAIRVALLQRMTGTGRRLAARAAQGRKRGKGAVNRARPPQMEGRRKDGGGEEQEHGSAIRPEALAHHA